MTLTQFLTEVDTKKKKGGLKKKKRGRIEGQSENQRKICVYRGLESKIARKLFLNKKIEGGLK